MDSAKNVRWMIPFKKFGRLWVKESRDCDKLRVGGGECLGNGIYFGGLLEEGGF